MRRGLKLAVMLMLPLAACGKDKAVEQVAKAPAGPRLTVAASDAPDWQSVSAEVTTQDQAQVLARIPGVLTTLSVRAGDSVRRGQVLGRITDSQLGYQAAAMGAQAAQAEAELGRVRFLYQNGVYAKARLEQAEAMAKSARAQTSAAGAVAGNGAVIAPATGRVLRADVPAGSPVAPGMVVAVVTSGPVVLRLDLPEGLAARVMPGAAVRVEGMSGQGSVTRVYPAVQAGQVMADVAMAGLDARLIGRRMPARVAAGTHRAIVVPKAFVSTRYGLDYVTLVGKNGAGAQVPVQTAAAADGKLEILSGVQAGDVLASEPQAGGPQ